MLLFLTFVSGGFNMAKMSGREIADKWGTNLSNATPFMKAGVDRMQVNPAEEAVKALPKMKANLIKAFDDGKVERGLRGVSKERWVENYKKGIDTRLGSGIEKSKEKAGEIFQKIVDYQDSYLPELHNKPNVTLEQGIERAVFNIRKMANFDKTK